MEKKLSKVSDSPAIDSIGIERGKRKKMKMKIDSKEERGGEKKLNKIRNLRQFSLDRDRERT